MKPDPKDEPRCAECGSCAARDMVAYCGHPSISDDSGECTQDDGPAPEWCSKRGDKKEGPYR